MHDDLGRPLERLAAFLRDELQKDDLTPALRDEYRERLERAGLPAPPYPETPVEELPLHRRTHGYLRRVGITTAGQLAALTEAERAALAYMGPQYLADIRVALREQPADAPNEPPA